MKYSILIVAYKSPDALGRCLDSLEKNPPLNSDREAEIVIVDNSPEAVDIPNRLLHALLLKYIRVIIVRDGTNRGFAEGCNEAARHANGEILVLINPDTMVFPEWAERMASYLDKGQIGAVGPVSNFVAGMQNIIYHSNLSKTWDKTAAMCRRGLNGRGVETKLLIGFFLMVRRRVWDEMNGLDGQFFLGCDDLDFSLRLRKAGYTLVIASDVFVFHEGHTSFEAMGNEASMALNKQAEKLLFAKLRKEYGEDLPTSTELWGCEILPTDPMKRQTLSACMIVRQEQAAMAELIPSLQDMADEIIIVETEPDGAKAVRAAQAYTELLRPNDTIHFFPWVDDFGAARNYALSFCTSDWVIWLDADDTLPGISRKKIRAAMDFPGPLTARKQCHFALRLRDHLPTGRFGYTDQPRIFPRLPNLHWEHRIHENYLADADRLGLVMVTTGIMLDHFGYDNAEKLAGKHERNLRILKLEKDTPLKFYQIGKSEMGLRRFEASRGAFRTAIERDWGAEMDLGFVAQVNYLMALGFYQEHGRAVPPMLALLLDNPKPDAIFLLAEVYLVEGNVDEAEKLYRQYNSFGEIMDYYGTDRDTFQPAAYSRLEEIEKARAVVYG